MIISPKKKTIKTKGSSQGVEKTGKRHTLKRRRFWQDDFSQKVCKQQKKRKTNGREKTEKHRKRKKEQEKTKGVTSFFTKEFKNKLKKRKWKKGRVQRRREKQEEIKRRRAETRRVLRKEGRKQLEKRDR